MNANSINDLISYRINVGESSEFFNLNVDLVGLKDLFNY